MLVGRSGETAAIDRLLEAARSGTSGVLVVRGDPGIGKSALLEHAVASAVGFTVLRGLAIQSESELAYGALHQILRPVLDRIEALPEPQAAALRAAFALSAETVDDRFRVSLATLSLLADVAEADPLLVVVDDAQWLDRPSADALVFVARRLEAESIVVLFGARDDDERPFEAPGLPDLRPAALAPEDARALVAARLGANIASSVVGWLVESSNGNPLALVELPATLSADQLAGHEEIVDELPPATSMESVYADRVARLEPGTCSVLVLAAAEETGARPIIERATAELGLEIGELAAAEAAGLVRVDQHQVAFRHPLVRSAVLRGAAFTEQERAHRILAIAAFESGDEDRAAWHRAAATVGPDEEVALALEETAARSRLRSGYGAAAAALDRAAALSADVDARDRRLVAAAAAAWQAGQPGRATALLTRAGPIVGNPRLAADVAHLRGVMGLRCGALIESCDVLLAGAAEVEQLDPHKALMMLYDAANSGVDAGDYVRVTEATHRAAALPRTANEQDSRLADLLGGVGSLIEGKTAREVPRVLEIVDHADAFDEPRWLSWASIGAGAVGRHQRGRELLRRASALARASGAVDELTQVDVVTAVEGIVSGQFVVEAEANEGLKLATDSGLVNARSVFLAVLAWFAAVAGRDEECLVNAAQATELARPNGNAVAYSIAEWAVALLDLIRARPEATILRLEELRASGPGAGQPYMILLSSVDLVEAGVRAGHAAAARTAYEVLAGFADDGPPWALALAARCRGLLEVAEDEFEAALQLHRESKRPFDLARTELLYGELLRRDRRRKDARDHLRVALELFEQLRAAPWEERARNELRATGETARKRDASTIADLTPQEQQIARLVAEGQSNKDVAAQLFLSPRTIEYHLRKVFTKLGITSRAELIRHGLAGQEATEAVTA